uniref:Uncharacterized protein n=1 Tax=Acrobeloides nanus TaxID=290746 RepID=A0A914EBJ8_9BILA
MSTLDYDINKQAVDYISLYVDQIQPQVKSLDPSRPFVLSSPSNGIFSEQEGGISRSLDPQDQFYGDVHYYIASGNMWSPSVYPIPRCATEFGIYSIPLTATMNRWVNPDEWTHGSYWMQMRQHYYEGNLHLLDMIFMYHLEVGVKAKSR